MGAIGKNKKIMARRGMNVQTSTVLFFTLDTRNSLSRAKNEKKKQQPIF